MNFPGVGGLSKIFGFLVCQWLSCVEIFKSIGCVKIKLDVMIGKSNAFWDEFCEGIEFNSFAGVKSEFNFDKGFSFGIVGISSEFGEGLKSLNILYKWKGDGLFEVCSKWSNKVCCSFGHFSMGVGIYSG